jgi:hypothetical protein
LTVGLIAICGSLSSAPGWAVAQDAGKTPPVLKESTEPTPPKPAATEEGQADLDEAMIRRIDAENPKQLQGVITLLESALAKGLSDESVAFAKKMIGSIQLERAQAVVAQLMQGGGVRAR